MKRAVSCVSQCIPHSIVCVVSIERLYTEMCNRPLYIQLSLVFKGQIAQNTIL